MYKLLVNSALKHESFLIQKVAYFTLPLLSFPEKIKKFVDRV